MIFEELFAQTQEEKVLERLDKIIDLLQMQKQPMTYVPYPVYTVVSPFDYYAPPVYPYVSPIEYTRDYMTHACLSGYCVSS